MPKVIDDYWRRQVLLRKVPRPDGRKLSAQQIETELDSMPRPDGVGAPPRRRTIHDMRPTKEELEVERWVYWPEVMGSDYLPWEASATVLRLLRLYLDRGETRPTVRTAHWFWRLVQATEGGVPEVLLEWHAVALAEREAIRGAPEPTLLRAVEAACAYRESTIEIGEEYSRAADRGVIPTKEALWASWLMGDTYLEALERFGGEQDRGEITKQTARILRESLQGFLVKGGSVQSGRAKGRGEQR